MLILPFNPVFFNAILLLRLRFIGVFFRKDTAAGVFSTYHLTEDPDSRQTSSGKEVTEMTRKVVFARLTALAAVIALLFALSSGNTNKLKASALAEEELLPAAEDGMNSQAAAEETASADPVEEDPETAENEEEIVSPPAEEAVSMDCADEDPEMTEDRQEIAPPSAEETVETCDDISAPVPEAKTEPEEPKAVPEEVKAVPEEIRVEPESEGESNLPEEASVGKAVHRTDPGNGEDLIMIGDVDAGHVSEALTEPFNHPDHNDRPALTGTAEIRLMNEGTLNYGDRIILKAEVRDVNTDYHLVWEANDHDDYGWFTVGSGDEYSFVLNKNNVGREYRVTVIAVD